MGKAFAKSVAKHFEMQKCLRTLFKAFATPYLYQKPFSFASFCNALENTYCTKGKKITVSLGPLAPEHTALPSVFSCFSMKTHLDMQHV